MLPRPSGCSGQAACPSRLPALPARGHPGPRAHPVALRRPCCQQGARRCGPFRPHGASPGVGSLESPGSGLS
eukprot:3776660-Alexandrium_andersonii.AAC.1